ncbi:TetR/AcrR family transcriptional regulator [Spirillospora sp. CA-294931]|uniref:TetR/AcrR family transcriptional regulator n=1 Tax=Spirillospora sp. CA-294931 TaxID=3240042 RepID=UPI003D9140FB
MPADKALTLRSRRVREAVLRAATQLLAEGGLPAATVDAVSARSGVSKATIYKHWSTSLASGLWSLGSRDTAPKTQPLAPGHR